MDHEAFDRFSRGLGRAGTRRTLLAVLFGSGTVGATGVMAKSSRHKVKASKAKNLNTPPSNLRECRNPGPGQNLSKCNFEGQNLAGKNLRGANLSGALLAFANLCSADLRGANLNKTDLTHAYLTRADLRGTNLSTAILEDAELCQTRMPNGKEENRDCPPPGADICCNDADCPAGKQCLHGVCGGPPPGSGQCVATGNVCDVTQIFGAPCCQYTTGDGFFCGLTPVPGIGSCQTYCATNADCVAKIGSPDVECLAGANCFLSPFKKCCFRRHTDNPASCASGISCRRGDVEDREFECCLPGETCDILIGCV